VPRIDGHGKLAACGWREAAAADRQGHDRRGIQIPGRLLGTRCDRIYLFGVGRGAYCAHAMARLLGTVGVLPDLMDYVLAAYAVPRTRRSPQDWRPSHSAGRPTGRTSRKNRVSRTVFWDSGTW